YCPVLVSEVRWRAHRIGCTRTTGMARLLMSPKEQGCARSGGPPESASVTTIMMASTISFVLTSDRTSPIAIIATELLRMLQKRRGYGAISNGGEPDAAFWIMTGMEILTCSFPTTCDSPSNTPLFPGRTATATGKEFLSNADPVACR